MAHRDHQPDRARHDHRGVAAHRPADRRTRKQLTHASFISLCRRRATRRRRWDGLRVTLDLWSQRGAASQRGGHLRGRHHFARLSHWRFRTSTGIVASWGCPAPSGVARRTVCLAVTRRARDGAILCIGVYVLLRFAAHPRLAGTNSASSYPLVFGGSSTHPVAAVGPYHQHAALGKTHRTVIGSVSASEFLSRCRRRGFLSGAREFLTTADRARSGVVGDRAPFAAGCQL